MCNLPAASPAKFQKLDFQWHLTFLFPPSLLRTTTASHIVLIMADHSELYGSCACERNQYTVIIPSTSASLAHVFFSNSAANREDLATFTFSRHSTYIVNSRTISSHSRNSLAPRPARLVPLLYSRTFPRRDTYSDPTDLRHPTFTCRIAADEEGVLWVLRNAFDCLE